MCSGPDLDPNSDPPKGPKCIQNIEPSSDFGFPALTARRRFRSPFGPVLGGPGGLLGASWGGLGGLLGALGGLLEAMLKEVNISSLLKASWGRLGAALGPSWGRLGDRLGSKIDQTQTPNHKPRSKHGGGHRAAAPLDIYIYILICIRHTCVYSPRNVIKKPSPSHKDI